MGVAVPVCVTIHADLPVGERTQTVPHGLLPRAEPEIRPGRFRLEYPYMLPIAIGVASVANGAGVGPQIAGRVPGRRPVRSLGRLFLLTGVITMIEAFVA